MASEKQKAQVLNLSFMPFELLSNFALILQAGRSDACLAMQNRSWNMP
jgi:hypothetical protein